MHLGRNRRWVPLPLLHTPHFSVFPHSLSPSSVPFIITLFLLKCYSPLSHYTTHSFLNNHTQFQTKMSKIYTGRFQTETSQKPHPLGPHIPVFYIAYIKEYPPLEYLSLLTMYLLVTLRIRLSARH